jgi:hypothetical protein
MADDFEHHTTSLTSPATAGEAIVPDDDADLSYFTRGLYVGSTGTIVAVMISGDEITLNDAQAGMIYPLRIRRVKATSTSAAVLIGLR